MANSKISALTSATTPLAGTEVLPIVQSSATVKATVLNVQVAPVSTGTANAIQYLNASKVPTTSSVLGFDGTTPALGVTPFAWGATIKAMDFGYSGSFGGNATANVSYAVSNGYFNGSWIYKTNGFAAYHRIDGSTGGHVWYTAASGTAGNAITFIQALTLSNSNDLTLNLGNLVIGTSGKGIDFSATAGTGTSELLADYEEGTWTPVLAFGGASVGITYAAQAGTYTKIGRLVTGRFVIVLSSKGSSTGAATIEGLPFTVGANLGSAVTEYVSNFVIGPPTQGYCSNAGTNIIPWSISATGFNFLADTNFANNTRLDMWFQYNV